MARRTYSEREAWGIFVGGLVIGIVITSVLWAYITTPRSIREIGAEKTEVSISEITFVQPEEFIKFCRKVGGIANWDNQGVRQCVVNENNDKNLLVMGVFCKQFGLNLTYGSFGIKCEGMLSE